MQYAANNIVHNTYGESTPVKLKNPHGQTQNSFTSLEAKPIIGGHNQQALQLRNQSVDQAKVFQKKQNLQTGPVPQNMN